MFCPRHQSVHCKCVVLRVVHYRFADGHCIEACGAERQHSRGCQEQGVAQLTNGQAIAVLASVLFFTLQLTGWNKLPHWCPLRQKDDAA